jgi:hypothetical protein
MQQQSMGHHDPQHNFFSRRTVSNKDTGLKQPSGASHLQIS